MKHTSSPYSVVLLGSGRVATHIGHALVAAGHTVSQVYGHSQAPAEELARALGCRTAFTPQELDPEAQIYLFIWKDDLLAPLAAQVSTRLQAARASQEPPLLLHTAGCVPMSVFAPYAEHYGVLYPLQTFTKERPLDFGQIPCFLEASDAPALERLRSLAESLTGTTYLLGSEQRRVLHLAGVFASNFPNHLYALAEKVLRTAGIPFSALLPLIDETAAKVHQIAPRAAQTGPACRGDEQSMERHLDLLAKLSADGRLSKEEAALMEQLYRLLSQSIFTLQNQ